MPLPYISIDNFRAFKEKCKFEFAPITILTGANSSGKSSLVDALRILQNYTDEIPELDKNDFWDKIINFNEDYFNYRIPVFKGLVNYNTGKDSICFEFKSRFIGMVRNNSSKKDTTWIGFKPFKRVSTNNNNSILVYKLMKDKLAIMKLWISKSDQKNTLNPLFA